MRLKLYYHVTLTDHLDSIRASGIQPNHISNWVKPDNGEAYGNGEIHAFTDRRVAVRWASNMDWGFYSEMASGNVAILEFKPEGRWKKDTISDPRTRLGYVDWVTSRTPVWPERIVAITILRVRSSREVVNAVDNKYLDLLVSCVEGDEQG